jgi:antitoxin VapB
MVTPKHFVSETIANYAVNTPARAVKLFRNGANQAVRIPKEFELPGNDALMHREGDKLIIEPAKPVHKRGSAAAVLAMLDELAKLGPIDEEFPDVDAGLLPVESVDLGEFDDEPPLAKQ